MSQFIVHSRDEPIGYFNHQKDAEDCAKKHVQLTPGAAATVYRKAVTFTSRVIVEDDLPRDAKAATP